MAINNPEMVADLREIIAMDEEAQIMLIFNGRTITGTKGNLVNAATFDRDGGGINPDDEITATFVASDFQTPPQGDELVVVNGKQLRLLKATLDDFRVGVVIEFTSVMMQ